MFRARNFSGTDCGRGLRLEVVGIPQSDAAWRYCPASRVSEGRGRPCEPTLVLPIHRTGRAIDPDQPLRSATGA